MANRTKRTPGSENGQVYLLWGMGTSSFKIGFTKGQVARRAFVIQAYSPVPILIQGQFNGTMQDEKDLHFLLNEFRIHGEWFELPESLVWKLLEHFGRDVPEVKSCQN